MLKIITILSVIFLFVSCREGVHDKNGVELAMKEYDRLIKKMDADSIALLYTAEGDLGSVAHGRDSIRRFLLGFGNYKVLLQSSTSDFVKIDGDTSIQKGAYRQVVITPGKDTVTVKGLYTASWLWIPGTGWHIKHMETFPAK